MSTDLSKWDEEGREGIVPAKIRTVVRGLSVEQLTEVINYLHPYVTGQMGEASPKQQEVYLNFIRQRALLAGAYHHPPAREPVVEPEVVESTVVDPRQQMDRVLMDLERLEAE